LKDQFNGKYDFRRINLFSEFIGIIQLEEQLKNEIIEIPIT